MDFGETFLGILTGLGLSVACGFRVFIPLLVASIAAQTGNIELAEGLTWLGEWPALIAFSVATVCEIILHYAPPGIDNIVDMIEAPLKVVAATVLSASMVADMSPLLQWSFAAIAGGGSAGLVSFDTIILRIISTVSTLGVGNPLLSTAENAGAVTVSILAILFPVSILFLFLVLLGVTAFVIKKWIVKRRRMPA